MAMRRKQGFPHTSPRPQQPIKYLTENGFSIIRLSEINTSVVHSPRECRFLVQDEHDTEREITVRFDDELVARLQLRRRIPLPEVSMFWLVCAESILATYLWEKDECPPQGRLILDDLPPDELMLAIHWRD